MRYGLKTCLTCRTIMMLIFTEDGPGSSVGIAIDYGLDGPGSNPGEDEISPPPDQSDPGAHLASCTMGTGSFPGAGGGGCC